jgi:hypothetical protein
VLPNAEVLEKRIPFFGCVLFLHKTSESSSSLLVASSSLHIATKLQEKSNKVFIIR